MAWFERAGGRLFYTVEGNGPAVVLLHSLGGSSAMWQSLTSCLSSDFTVVAFDACGHGRTEGDDPFSMAGYVRDALTLMDHLDLASFHVVGISMGGRAAVRTALARPESVRSIVVADTGTGDGSGSPERIAAVKRRIEEIGLPAFALEYTKSRLMPDTPSEVADRYVTDVMRTLPDVYLTTLLSILMEDLRPHLGNVRVPALVVTGEHDVSAPPQTAKQLADGIEGARFAVIPSANHFSNLDQPERFNALIRDFLRERHGLLPPGQAAPTGSRA